MMASTVKNGNDRLRKGNRPRRSTGMFCHVVFTILNHVTKLSTPSLDKDSATESKACGLVKFWILRKKPCFVFDLLLQDQATIFSLICN